MNFENKNIILTGASSGIGFELAKLLARENCKIALLARRKEILDDLAKEISSSSNKILPIKCDVTKKEEVENSINKIKNDFGKIDLAILNAGTSFRASVDDFHSEDADETFAVNVMGIIYFVEFLLPDFKKDQNGIIAGVTSMADQRGFPKSGFYCASKAAASKFLESLRIELKDYNIKVITIKPGFVRTPMTDKNEFYMPFLMEPDKAANIIIKGLKKEKRVIQFPFITAVGSMLSKFIPNPVFDYFAKKHLDRLNKQD